MNSLIGLLAKGYDPAAREKELNELQAQRNALAYQPEELAFQSQARQWAREDRPYKNEQEALNDFINAAPMMTLQNYPIFAQRAVRRGANPNIFPHPRSFSGEEDFQIKKNQQFISAKERASLLAAEIRAKGQGWKPQTPEAAVAWEIFKAGLKDEKGQSSIGKVSYDVYKKPYSELTPDQKKDVDERVVKTGEGTADERTFQAWLKVRGNEGKNIQDYMMFKAALNKSGLQIEFDENGKVTRITQGELGKGDITTKVKGEMQTDITKLIEQASSMKKIGSDFKREYLTYWGRIKQSGLNIASKAGADIGPEGKEYVGGMRAFVERVEAFYQKWRKEITGAQAVMKEIEMLRESVLNKKVSPDEFEASYNRMMDDIELSLKLKTELMKKGFSGKELGAKIDELFFERKGAGKGNPAKEDWIRRAKMANPKATEKELSDYYDQNKAGKK